MPWNDNSGGNGGGPWGQPPSGGGGRGGGGGQPPDLEDLLRRGQDRFRDAMPNGNFSGSTFIVGLLIILLIWGLSGFYTVQADEEGVVLRFGKFNRSSQPGLNYHLPYPIETVFTPRVTTNNKVVIGDAEGRMDESLMLTGDENIAAVSFSVNWQIRPSEQGEVGKPTGAADYLFNVENPDATVKAVAESAMREVVGRNTMEFVRTVGREQVQVEAESLIQATLDEYGAGIEVTQVQISGTPPPQPVEEAYNDLQDANQDKERVENEARKYANKKIPEARGQAFRLIQEAEAYRQQTVAEAVGQASRFTSIYNEYKNAKDVTRQRMFLETMERVFNGMDKVIIDNSSGDSGVIPYLPLNELRRGQTTQEGN